MIKPSNLLVFGKTGQVATELAALADVTCVGRDVADLSDPAACVRVIQTLRPAAVINAAAYTAVDRAEEEEALATLINAESPAAMAMACADLAVPFVHISTDYVFDGTGITPWTVDAPTSPLGAYGRSKLAGEQAVRAAGGVHCILRTSWVVSAHGNNFVRTMHRLGAERDRLTVVADQVGGLTPAGDIARVCHFIARSLVTEPEKSGTYHFAGAPDASWADVARAVMAQAGHGCEIVDIPASEYPTPARRPLNSRLDCSTLETAFGLSRPDWRAALPGMLSGSGISG